jgi:hypothetical protein
MTKLTATGSVKDGVLKIFHRAVFTTSIANLPDGVYEVVIKKRQSKRSNSQNAYYWGVVIQCFVNGYKDKTGEDIDSETAHWLLKHECNYIELVNEDTGECTHIPKSTKDLGKSDFGDYVVRCCEFIYTWFGIIVPKPEEQTEINF